MTDQTSETSTKSKKNKTRRNLILVALIAVLVGGALGYVIGKNITESNTQTKLEQQVRDLKQDLETAKNGVSDDLEEGQDAVNEGKQTVESLQAENATLKTTIEQQNKKIADLEKQLEDAQNADDSSTTSPQ